MNFPFDFITDFIFVEESFKSSDVILIPGGSHPQIIEHACKLYNMGMASYIIPSGGPNPKLPEYESEWEFLYEKARKLGVPHSAILKEDKASHTFENAEFSLAILKEKNIEVKRAIIVCKAYHARRALLTYQTVFSPDVCLYVSPVIDDTNIRPDNWFLDSKKINKVMNEVVKIGTYFEKHIANFYKEYSKFD